MVQSVRVRLDAVFAALSNATRRAVLEALAEGSLPVSALARSHRMSLSGFMKHLRVLESAGLLARSKEGRIVRCALTATPMQDAALWLAQYGRFWVARREQVGRKRRAR
ncbi:MAG: transcriptional regulator, ArsR family [Myxococcales bacterium]|nr:transcriptional regulator, ArsR family [Myxococcales bacterium]